jgi:hypothetical protein
MKMSRCIGCLAATAVLLAAAPVLGEESFMTDLAGSLTLRSQVGGEAELDSPGGGLRLDFGRHVGHGFWLLGTMGWAHLGGKRVTDCPDCLQTETADSLLGGLGFRYVLPIPEMEMFLQAGLGYVIDILDRQKDNGKDAPAGLHGTLAFAGSIGVGFEIMKDVQVGFKMDTLLGSDLDALSLGCYTGLRY